jgi:hypothetical protein
MKPSKEGAFEAGARWASNLMLAGIAYEIDGKMYRKISDLERYRKAIIKDSKFAAKRYEEENK